MEQSKIIDTLETYHGPLSKRREPPLPEVVRRRVREEDEQELSLGMPDTSPTYLVFYCSMLLSTVLDYIGLYFPLLYYFWTNLLTGGPAQHCWFLPI